MPGPFASSMYLGVDASAFAKTLEVPGGFLGSVISELQITVRRRLAELLLEVLRELGEALVELAIVLHRVLGEVRRPPRARVAPRERVHPVACEHLVRVLAPLRRCALRLHDLDPLLERDRRLLRVRR